MYKWILFTFLFLVACSGNSIQGGSGTSMSIEERRIGQERYFPVLVRTLPSGFIAVESAIEDLESAGALRFLFWSTNVVFQDIEGVTIFQTDVHDSNFIVIYRNAYYVNEERFLEIAEYAINTSEQFNKIYSIGDTIEMRGRRDGDRATYNLRITEVERAIIDEFAVYEINFSVYPSVSQNYLLDFFEYVETVNRIRHNEFAFLVEGEPISIFDSNERTFISEGIVRIEISNDEEIDIIVLNIPTQLTRSVSQNSMRRVRINQPET